MTEKMLSDNNRNLLIIIRNSIMQGEVFFLQAINIIKMESELLLNLELFDVQLC